MRTTPSPAPAPRPQHQSLAQAQQASSHQFPSSTASPGLLHGVPTVHHPILPPTPGPYSYAGAAQQGARTNISPNGYPRTPASPLASASGQLQHHDSAPWAYLTPPFSGQTTAESSSQAQRREYQRALYQSANMPQTPSNQQRHPSTAVPTDFLERQVNQDPTNVAVWNGQPRTAADRTSAITPNAAWSPNPTATTPGTLSRRSSGQRSARRTKEQMRDSTDVSNQSRCHLCQQYYSSPLDLRKHIQRSHADIADRRHACEVDSCPWRFNHPREVNRHVRSAHPGVFPETARYYCRIEGCQYGGVGFVRKDNRDRHERKHSEDGSQPMSRSSSSRTFES